MVKRDLTHYLTARLDIKNCGKLNNKIEFLFISDEGSDISFPDWFKHEDGEGAVIESSKGKLDLKIKCIHDGNLLLRLRGIHARSSDGLIIPIFIEYKNIIVNGKELLNENKLASHDDFFEYRIKVSDEDIIFLQLVWVPFKPR